MFQFYILFLIPLYTMKISIYSLPCMMNDIQSTPHQKLQQFNIPKFYEYSFLNIYEYTLSQLKDICIFYKIKCSGSKSELYKRIYNYLYCSFFIQKIQKLWRGYLQRLCNHLRGPGFKQLNNCVNESDFLTMEPLNEISIYQIFTFKENNVLYGCDIKSIYEWIKKSNINPYTRNEFENNTIDKIHKLIIISNCLNLNIEIINDYSIVSYHSKIINLLSIIDSYGYYTNPDWILNLNRTQIILFLRELYNIWNYKLMLNDTIKKNICPSRGNPFTNIDLDNIIHENINNVKKYNIIILNKFITSGINQEFKYLGSTYILMALTKINSNVALSYPWLYESIF
jgi:hypothetical protein